MKRQIKFRAWFPEKGFADEVTVYSDGSWDANFEDVSGYGEKDGGILQEFTGLKDKKDKEIYEGDMVKAYKPNSYLNGIYEVAWHETKGCWFYKNQPSYKDLYQVGCEGNTTCEIIGNIFENSELTNKK